MGFLDKLAGMSSVSFPDIVDLAAGCMAPALQMSAKSRVSGGIRLLNRESELNDYLVAFGEIHRAKLLEFLPRIPFEEFREKGLVVIDWGCGQGLATAVTLDFLRKRGLDGIIRGVRLLELVPAALHRAKAIVHRYLAASSLTEIRAVTWNSTGVDEVVDGLPPGVSVLHLFSNILDVRTIDLQPVQVAVGSLRAGRQSYVLSVGPDRETTTSRPERVGEFYQMFTGKRLIHAFPTSGNGRIYGTWRYWPYAYCKCYGIAYALTPTSAPTPTIPVMQPEPVAPPPPPLPAPDPEDVLMYASADLSEELAAALRAGAPADAANEKGATALYFAAKHGCINSVRMLIEAGANAELSVRTTLMTPFLIAVKYEHLEVASYLRDKGCNTRARDARGRSATELVRLYGLSPETKSFVEKI